MQHSKTTADQTEKNCFTSLNGLFSYRQNLLQETFRHAEINFNKKNKIHIKKLKIRNDTISFPLTLPAKIKLLPSGSLHTLQHKI